MKTLFQTSLAGAALAVLSASISPLAMAATPGVVLPFASNYQDTLAHAYGHFAHLEGNDETDQMDWHKLNDRAIKASNGGVVTPLQPSQVRSVQASPAQLDADYAAISRVIGNADTMRTHPREVAVAQAAYDCYMLQQQSEPNASHNLRRCEPTFRYLMSKLDKPVEPAVAAAPAPTMLRYDVVDSHAVYFGWDKSTLDANARAKLDDIKASLQGEENAWKRIALTGHADRSGPVTYNQRLSERRLRAVADYLGVEPVNNAEVDFKAYGETNLPVATNDGVREPRNRVVTLSVVKEKFEESTETNRDPR